MSTTQQIFGLKEFADTLIDKADRAVAKQLIVYFFPDKVLTRTFKKSETYYLQPIFCVLSTKSEITKTYKLVDMIARFGGEFGIRFGETKARKLIPGALVNAIRIDVSELHEYSGFKYYQTKIYAPDTAIKCVQTLTDRLHPTADVFRLLPKPDKVDEQLADLDDDACV
jgi:hypothetical protein